MPLSHIIPSDDDDDDDDDDDEDDDDDDLVRNTATLLRGPAPKKRPMISG